MTTDPRSTNTDMHVFRIGPDWVVAADETDAIAVVNGYYCPMGGSEVDANEVAERLDDAATLTITNDDDTRTTKTNAEWASRGRGSLCSTEW